MQWLEALKGDSLAWLLEPDTANPAVRYFALRDLLDRPADDAELRAAKAAISTSGPVPAILNAQHPDGYWEKPGVGYGKYKSTEWQIIILGELGAEVSDERVRRGCEYLFNHSVASNGGFTASTNLAAGGVIHCLNGNLLYALIQLGLLNDPRTQQALVWQAHAITGEGSLEFTRTGTTAPDFACSSNDDLGCGWGATKAMKALLAVPPPQRTPSLQRALERGKQFLLSFNVAQADYPNKRRVSDHWFELGFPLSYWSDVLETLSVLVTLGCTADPHVIEAYRWLLDKQDAQGRWTLESSLNRKMWINIEKIGKPSKWVTLRALRVIKAVELSRLHPVAAA